jgi:hypothetical protein
VPPPPESQLSPAGDNWPLARPGVGERADLLPGEERSLQVVLAYVGGLPKEQLDPFCAWIHQAGVASVWEVLEESFGHGPAAVRHRLHQRLEAEPGPTV